MSVTTDLIGVRLEIWNATRTKRDDVGRCRAVHANDTSLLLVIEDDDGYLKEWSLGEGYQVRAMPPDNPLERNCTQCSAEVGLPCRVMAPGHYHDVRKAT